MRFTLVAFLSLASTLTTAAPVADETTAPTTKAESKISPPIMDPATVPQPSRRSPHNPDPWSTNEEMSITFYRYSNRFNVSVGTTDTKMFDDFSIMANGECYSFTSPHFGDPPQQPFHSYTWDITWEGHTNEGGEYTPKNKGNVERGLAKEGGDVDERGVELEMKGKKSPPPTKWPGCQGHAKVTIYQKRLCYGEHLDKSLWNNKYMFNVPEYWGGAQSVRVMC